MLTSKEVQNILTLMETQVNQAFDQRDETIKALEARVAALESAKPEKPKPKAVPKKKAA